MMARQVYIRMKITRLILLLPAMLFIRMQPGELCMEPYGAATEQEAQRKSTAKTEERINLDALAYNLIRLYNIKQEIENTTEDLEDFCESTSIKNQLQLIATIF